MEEIHRAALIVGRSSKDIDTTLNRLFQIFIIALPLTLVLAGGGGLFLLRRVLIPVKEMTDTAREIEEKDLSRRIDVKTDDELGKLANTLNLMIEKLDKAFQRQKELTGDASHELRAPLAVIQAEATLALQREREASSYKKSLEVIAQESDHMSGILNQLLTLARADSGKVQMTIQAIHLNPFLEALGRDIEVLCHEKGLTLHMEFHEQLYIEGDPGMMRNMILNLLTNAIRYTDKAGKITMALSKETGHAVVSISDTGIGIPKDALPYIFNRFYRVDKARSRAAGGSGLGLAISKQIIDMHGGTLQVKSEMNHGSTFVVRLPLTVD